MTNAKLFLRTTVLWAAILGFSPTTARAEDSPSESTVSGQLDFYYQVSPQGHSSASTTGPRIIEGRSFDRHSNEMTLNMAELTLKKKTGKVSLRLDLAAGEMIDQLAGGSATSVSTTNPVNPAANESTRNIPQATLSYQATERLAFMVGKFYTNIGLEMTHAKENWQYSRSYLFNYGPFWHQGASVTYNLIPGQLTGTLALLNAWDGRISQQTNQGTTVAVNLSSTPTDQATINYNYIGGDEASTPGRREIHELNATYRFSELTSAAIDLQMGTQKEVAGIGTGKWSGVALYFKTKINKTYSVSPRFEHFDDSSSGFAIVGALSAPSLISQRINAWTLTNSFDLGDGLEVRMEARVDESSSDQFFRDQQGALSHRQESFTAAFLATFE